MSAASQQKDTLLLIKVPTGGQVWTPRSQFFDDSFYFAMSLVIAFVVAYGFSRTITTGLIHPQSPQPLVLYFHAVIFSGWVLFFILQSALVRTRNVTLHRQLGWFGFAPFRLLSLGLRPQLQ